MFKAFEYILNCLYGFSESASAERTADLFFSDIQVVAATGYFVRIFVVSAIIAVAILVFWNFFFIPNVNTITSLIRDRFSRITG